MRGKAALVLCFAAVAIWTSNILDDEFHDERASHQLEAVLKEEQDVPMSSSIGFLRRLSVPGNAQLAKEMDAKSGRRNVQETPVPVRVLSDGFTPLHEAAKDGDVSEVKELLSKGAEVNAKTTGGFTPLHYAAWKGHLDVVKELLAKGAEVDAKSNGGYTPLHYAASDVEVVKMLLAKGAEVDAKDEDVHMLLHKAASKGDVDLVKALLAKGAEVDAKDKYRKTPLHLAAYNGHLEVVKALLSNGAEVDAKTINGYTPVQVAHDEDVLKAFGQHFIKLAQRAKKSKESKEAPKIVKDTLQARCLPEVAQWAVNHSYGIDAFPAEDSTARSCVLQYMSFEARARLALGSKWSYVFPGAGAAIAAMSVYMVEPLILRHFGSVDASADHEETHKFYHGARLLVARATINRYWPKMAFRFFEVITIIACLMGFVMVFVWWVWWLPFVGLLCLLPGIKLYSSKALIRAPVLCIASMNTQKGFMLSFLRVVLILAAFISVGATTGWQSDSEMHWDFSSLKMEIFVNPLFEGLQNKIRFMWPEATLAPLLDRITYFATLGSKNSINDIPWVNDHIKWLPQANALVILELGIGFLVVSSLLYLSLLVRMLHQRCKDGDIPDINYISYAKRLAESTNVPRLVEEMKQEEPPLQVELIGKCSLAFKLLFVALDVYFDVNTIRTLILSSNLRFACALTFVVARSAFREWNNFSGLKEAVCESYERGMLHDKLIDLLEEEKGAEAFFSLSITSYSYVYCVQTAGQAMTQWCSILLAAYGIAEFLVQKMEFPTTELPTTELPTTEKVNSFVLVPSEEIQKEKGDA